MNIIIPFYNKNIYRFRNLKFSVNYYRHHFPSSNIIVSEQNSNTDLSELPINSHILIDDSEYFLKSKVINEAVNTIENDDIIIMIDNDCIINPSFLDDIPEEFDVITPFDQITFLNEGQTRKFIASYGNEYIEGKCDLPIYRYTGGLTIFTKESFNKLGGFDEEFLGWGGEDCAFIEKCNILDLKYYRTPGRVTHIFHPDESKNKNSQYNDNRKLLLACKFMDKYQLEDKISNSNSYTDYYDDLSKKYPDNFIVDVSINIGSLNIKFDNSIYAIKDELSLNNVLSSFYDANDYLVVKQICESIVQNSTLVSEDDLCIAKKYLSIL
jgi:hypothetical protein